MSLRSPRPDPTSEIEAIPTSRAVELLALDQGYRVQRLAADYLVIDGAHRRRVAFAGLLGTSVTRPAVVLAADIALTRGHLSSVGLKCLPFRARSVEQTAPQWAAVGSLASTLRVRHVMADDALNGVGRAVSDEIGFLTAWAELSDHGSTAVGSPQILIEPDLAGEEYDLYVVGKRVVAGYGRRRIPGVDPENRSRMAVAAMPPEVSALAIRAIEAMPGTTYGTVRVMQPSGSRPPEPPRIYTVELLPPPALLTSAKHLRLAAEAVLEQETGKPVRPVTVGRRSRRWLRPGRFRSNARR
jgi:hypothetical protein